MTKKELAQYQALKTLKQTLNENLMSAVELADKGTKRFTSKDVNCHLASLLQHDYVKEDYEMRKELTKTYVNIDNPNDIITKTVTERYYYVPKDKALRMKLDKENIDNAVKQYLLTMANIEKGGE